MHPVYLSGLLGTAPAAITFEKRNAAMGAQPAPLGAEAQHTFRDRECITSRRGRVSRGSWGDECVCVCVCVSVCVCVYVCVCVCV